MASETGSPAVGAQPRGIARVAAALIAVLASAPEIAAAGSDDEAAKQEYASGWQALEAGEYARALGHYQRSYELVPRPRTMFNIAVAEEKLGRLDDAWRHYRAFLEQAQARDSEFVDQARQRIAALEKRVLGRLAISSRPAGASVYVDGGATPRGKTPMTLELVAGSHRVRVVGRGAAPLERSVEVVAGRRRRERFVFNAVKPGKVDRSAGPVGTLTVHANVGATVSVDGLVVGTTSLATASSESRPVLHHQTAWGPHTVIVEQPDGRAWRKQLHLSPDETVTIAVEFSDRTRRRRLVTWGLAGFGAASVATGVTLGVLAIKDVTRPTSDDHSRGKSRALMAYLLIVGGAAALFGAWWRQRKPAARAQIHRTHTGE